MTAIFFTLEAEAQAISEDAEWRQHAKTNPDLFSSVASSTTDSVKEVIASCAPCSCGQRQLFEIFE